MSAATDAAKTALTTFNPLSSGDALNQASNQYGVADSQTRLSALKGVVGNLTTSLDSVDPSVTGRTSGTFTTEGQRQALVSKEQAPIATNLSREQGALTSENQDLTSKQSLAAQMASALISDNKEAYQRLLDQYNASTAADAAAEQKAEADRQFAESQRQFNVQQATAKSTASSKGSSSAASKTDTISSLNDDILSNVSDFKNKPTGWTEKVLIPQLIAAYPELTAKQITDNVYNLRKQYE